MDAPTCKMLLGILCLDFALLGLNNITLLPFKLLTWLIGYGLKHFFNALKISKGQQMELSDLMKQKVFFFLLKAPKMSVYEN